MPTLITETKVTAAEGPVGRVDAPPLGLVERLAGRTGLPLFCVDATTGEAFGGPEEAVPESVRSRLAGVTGPALLPLKAGRDCYAVPLPEAGGRYFAVGYQDATGGRMTAGSEAVGGDAVARYSPAAIQSLLRLAVAEIESEQRSAAAQSHVDQLSEQLDRTYEEISLLHTLTRNLQISRGPADLALLCLERMPELIGSEGHLIRLETPGEDARTLTRGDLPFDPWAVPRLVARFASHDWSRPLVQNNLDLGGQLPDYPKLRNLIAVPVREGTHRFGWIVSTNMKGGQEFGTVEASFLNTIGTILGTHVRNIDLLREQNDLLVGFVRSFVSTLDAKDPYTRGHSERVALIARRVGKSMGLPDDELKTIHLSGLLHDIGKIGVDDRILRKPGALTDEEFDHVKKHPMIGFNILSGLKHLKHVLPGVRNHHENFDGTGYPDGLAGEDIPLLARVLAVADAYDAMGSDRPYRKGMPVEKIDDIFRKGSGRQWDPRVIDAYFRCREDVRLLCSAYSLEVGCAVEGDGA